MLLHNPLLIHSSVSQSVPHSLFLTSTLSHCCTFAKPQKENKTTELTGATIAGRVTTFPPANKIGSPSTDTRSTERQGVKQTYLPPSSRCCSYYSSPETYIKPTPQWSPYHPGHLSLSLPQQISSSSSSSSSFPSSPSFLLLRLLPLLLLLLPHTRSPRRACTDKGSNCEKPRNP